MEPIQQIEQIIQEGDLDALTTLLAQLKTTTDFETMYDTALLLSTFGFLKEADELYDVLLTHLPDEAQLKIDRAGVLIEMGKEDEALLLLADIRKNDPEYLQSLVVQADYYQMIGLTETAIMKITEAHQLAPNEPIIQFAYAELLLDTGRFAEAVKLYLQVYEETEAIGEVQLVSRIAEAYSAGGAFEEALPYYELQLKDHTSPEALFGVAYSHYQIGQATQALKHLDELIAMDPDYYAAYMLAGQAHLLLEENKEAYEKFKAGIARDAYDKELHLSAGKCALKLGLQDEAEQYLSEALALEPEYIEALVTLASLYNETERDEALLQLVGDAKEQVEALPLVQAFYAYSLERMEYYDEAYDAYTKAYNGMKEDYSFLHAYASFLLEEGRRAEAIRIAKEIIAQFPEAQYWQDFLMGQYDEEE